MNFMDDIKEQLLKKEFEYDAVDADRGKMDRNASAIINALENSGYEAYAVGGCVRDLLLAKAPHDWDITTSAKPEEIISVMGRNGWKTVDGAGRRFGTVIVVINHIAYEVTTFRNEFYGQDSHRPENITFSSTLKEDLSRRDFTVNALALGRDGVVYDYFDGTKDLENKKLRTVGEAEERFREDALRLFRACRFIGQLDFMADKSLVRGMASAFDRVSGLSLERVKEEVEKLRTELSMLVLERDELQFVECRNLEMAYLLALGSLEYRIYEAQCTLLRQKRKMELIQARQNRQEHVVLSEIAQILDREFLSYQKKLEEQMEKMNDAIQRSQAEALSDEEAMELVNQGINPLLFRGLKTTITSDESRQINFDTKPKVILSASGMCEAGRIRHHLKHNLWRPECTICFVGYQAVGTLGRKLIEGAESVKLFGENITVNARIEVLKGISGHADMNGLLDWIRGFEKIPDRVMVVHGEDTVTDHFAKLVEDTFGCPAFAPYSGGTVDLAANEIITIGQKIPKKSDEKPSKLKSASAFNRLVAAAKRLLNVVYKNEGLANKDMAKFETQIQNLADKWDR